MNFEKQQLQQNIDEAADLELADKFEREKINEIKEDIEQALQIIRDVELFDEKYIDNIVLVARANDGRKYKFQKNEVVRVESDEYLMDDFMQGNRTDFVGITPREDFEVHMKNAFEQKQVFEVAFFDDVITYEEFVEHEMAHNVFDLQYTQRNGDYIKKDERGDVSEEYREKIKNIIIPLINKYYPNFDANKFEFNRQQIAEIFAFLHQREFCRRSNINVTAQDKLDTKSQEFFANPEEMLNKFNQQHNTNFTIDGNVYKENHVLSLVIAPLLEKEYPNWEERINIF